MSALRARDVPVPTGATVTYARALALAGSSPAGAYWAGRATLVVRPEHVAAYDEAFGAVMGGLRSAAVRAVTKHVEVHLDADDEDGAAPAPDDGDPSTGEVRTVRWSATEVLRQRDLGACTPDELAEAHRLMARLRVHAVRRPSRRRRPASGDRGELDLRRTVRRSLRTGGEVLGRATVEPGERPRRLVLLLDVSGSMEPYARSLARFAHAAVAGRRRGQVEAFALGTRVTRVTRELATHDPDAALRRAAAAVADWSGGTRLGEGLRRFNDRWGVRGLGRGRRRRDPLRRMGSGRPGGAGRRAGPPATRGAPHRVGQPAEGVAGLRAAGRRHGGGVAARRRVRRGAFGGLVGGPGRGGGTSGAALMRDLLDELDRWRTEGVGVAVARVVDLDGSGPRAPGAAMAVNERGEVVGSVSGGCVEGAVVTEALEVLRTGERKVVTFGYSDDEAFAVGLTCGGIIHLYLEPLDW